MKYTILGLDQKLMCEWGIDLKDALILRYVIDLCELPGMIKKKLDDGAEYTWIKYEKLIEEFPILGFGNNAKTTNPKKKTRNARRMLWRNLQKLIAIGVLEHHQDRQGGIYSYFRLTPKCDLLRRSSDRQVLQVNKGSHPTSKSPPLLTVESKGFCLQSQKGFDCGVKTKDPPTNINNKLDNNTRGASAPFNIESKSSKESKKDYEKIEQHFINLYREITEGKEPEFNYGAVRRHEKEYLQRHTVEEIKDIITAAKEDEWIRENGAFDLMTILSARMFNKLQLQKYGHGSSVEEKEKKSSNICPICDIELIGARPTCPVCELPFKDFTNPEAVRKYKERLKDEGNETRSEFPFSKMQQETFINKWKNKLKEQKHTEITYPEEFETWWKNYPRKADKKKAFKCWLDCLGAEDATFEILLTAAENYKAACKKKGTAENYIKLPSTFLGPDEPWRDHITGRGSPPGSKKSSRICPICDIELIGPRFTCPVCELPVKDFTNPEAVEKYKEKMRKEEEKSMKEIMKEAEIPRREEKEKGEEDNKAPKGKPARFCPICFNELNGDRLTCSVCKLPVKDFRNSEAVRDYILNNKKLISSLNLPHKEYLHKISRPRTGDNN